MWSEKDGPGTAQKMDSLQRLDVLAGRRTMRTDRSQSPTPDFQTGFCGCMIVRESTVCTFACMMKDVHAVWLFTGLCVIALSLLHEPRWRLYYSVVGLRVYAYNSTQFILRRCFPKSNVNYSIDESFNLYLNK